MLEGLGISVEFSHHEGAPGQQEIDLRYADALTTADNVMTFRLAMKEVALQQGVYASFMPKPFTEHPGSGMHTHMSLFEGDRNVFYEPGGEYQLSKVGRAFIAGLLRHAAEITAVCNQWVNSYKRLWGGTERIAGAGGEAPAYICWGHNNRSALIRVPMYKPKQGQRHQDRVPLDRPGVQSLSGVRGHPRRRAAGHRGRLRAAARRRGRRLGADLDRAACARHRPAAAEPVRGHHRHAGQRACRARRWASRSSTSSCATSARSGRSTGGRSASSSWSGTSECSNVLG